MKISMQWKKLFWVKFDDYGWICPRTSRSKKFYKKNEFKCGVMCPVFKQCTVDSNEDEVLDKIYFTKKRNKKLKAISKL